MWRILSLLVAWLGICAASPSAELAVRVTNDSDSPLADAVIFMPDRAKGAATARGRGAIVQRDRIFQPFVTVVRRGTAINFPNDDPFMHHVYSFSPAKHFEIKLYKGTPASPVVFDRSGVVVLGCNVHDWMIAYVLVVDTPVFEKTGKDGVARFGNLPAGPHQLMVWVPGMREPASLLQLTLAEGESRSISHRLNTPVKKQPLAPPFDPLRYSFLPQGKTQQPGDFCTSPGS
jgi:plastocyanin